MSKRSVLSVLAVLLLVLAVPLAAWEYRHQFVWTGYNTAYGLQIGAHGQIESETWVATPSNPAGPTYVKVRVDGFHTGQCYYGFPEEWGWCADNAHGGWASGWSSRAQVLGPYQPYGCYTSTIIAFVEGYVVENYPIGGCWYPPPPEQCDPGLDGSYQPGACVSPIAIDTSKKADYKLDPQVRVQFDLTADGSPEQTGWTKRNSTIAFLAQDRNGNGVIDDGRELYGDHTRPDAVNGFDALLKEANAGQAGSIDASHPLFARLLLWRDANQDGYSQPEELTAASAELEAIGLGYYRNSAQPDKVGNELRYVGWARRLGAGEPASREFKIFDVYFRVQ